MSLELKEAQRRAQKEIEAGWKSVAKDYTVGWIGNITAAELRFPHLSSGVSGIKDRISPSLPTIVYQSRESPPQNVSVAVPYESDVDPFKCRLVATNHLSPEQRNLLGQFAQAIWFLIESGALPHPADGDAFEQRFVEWTDPRLISL